MCNACNNMCCGSDGFGGCGCDSCDEPECWADEDEFDREDLDYACLAGADWSDHPLDYVGAKPVCARCRPARRKIACEAIAALPLEEMP